MGAGHDFGSQDSRAPAGELASVISHGKGDCGTTMDYSSSQDVVQKALDQGIAFD